MNQTLASSLSEVQERLVQLGYDIPASEIGKHGDETKKALAAYQDIHGLTPTGELDTQTWNEITTSSYNLGDRLLYERQPLFRGEDVAELQHHLNALGFDAGREDGFFRAETAQALREFQRNMGISSDGICGPNTVVALKRVNAFASSSATNLREQIRWQFRDDSKIYRIGISLDPTFTVIGDRLIKELFDRGIKVPLYYEGGDDSEIAAEANSSNIDFLFSLKPSFAASGRTIFFSNDRYRSMVGAALAGSIQHELSKITKSDPDESVGRMYPLLRESKMPSVIIEICDTSDISMVQMVRERSTEIAVSITNGILSVIETK